MTEFEIATIAYQNATLAYQNDSLWIREVGLWIAAGTLVVGLAQCALIWAGIRMMRRAADTRDRGLENQRHADEHRHAEAGQRHAEAMAALDKRHAEAMAALNELIAGSREQGAALQTATAALRTLVERTAPKRTAE